MFFKVIYSYKEQRSINDILPVLFDNLLPSFSKLHNSSFIEGPVFISEKLNKVLIYGLIRIKRYTTQGILKSAKQMEIWGCKIRRVGWMWQHTPYKLQQFLTGDQTCVWSCIVVMKHHAFTINELWTFLDDGFVQTVQLPTVHI